MGNSAKSEKRDLVSGLFLREIDQARLAVNSEQIREGLKQIMIERLGLYEKLKSLA
jgi:hypothetical protein